MLVILEAARAEEIKLSDTGVGGGIVWIFLLCALESAHGGFFVSFGKPERAEFEPLGGREVLLGYGEVIGEVLPDKVDGDGVVVAESHAGAGEGFVEDASPCIDADDGVGFAMIEGATAISAGDLGGVLDLVDGAVGEADQAGDRAGGCGDIFGAHGFDATAFGGEAHGDDVVAEGGGLDGGERSVGIGAVAFKFEQSDINVLALEGARAACFEVVLLGGLSEGVLVVGLDQAGFDGLSVGSAIPVDAVVLDELAAFPVKDNVVVGNDVAIGGDDKSAACGDVTIFPSLLRKPRLMLTVVWSLDWMICWRVAAFSSRAALYWRSGSRSLNEASKASACLEKSSNCAGVA